MNSVQADGFELVYETTGDKGSPVLLIMGYCVPGKAWRFQVPTLANRHRVATFDHRGVGDSGSPPTPWRMEDLARDALALLDHLSWPKAHIVGVSMGGMIAQELALRWPHRLLSLSLIATTAGGRRALLPTLEGTRRFLGTSIGGPTKRLDNLKRLLFPADFIATCDPKWLDDVMLHDFGRPIPAKTRRGQLGAIQAHNTAKRLKALPSLPTLIVRAGRDLLIRPEESDRLARHLPHARLMRLDDAGHGLIRQRAERLNEGLLAHFSAVDLASSRPRATAPALTQGRTP